MKTKRKIVIALMIMIIGFSCAKITDEPVDFNTVDAALVDSLFAKNYISSVYNYVPDGYNRLQNSMLDASTDLAVNSFSGSPAFLIGTGSWGPSDNPDDVWAENYKGIRAVNIFFKDIEPNLVPPVFNSQQYVNKLVGQAYFLRGLFYSELAKRYGGVPIVEEVFEAGQNVEISRTSYDNTIQYISDQFDKAAEFLPVSYENNNASDFGRATKGAALALKSRMLLYAASPLLNDPQNSQSTPWQGAYDPQKWEQAADAAFRVIELDEYVLNDRYFQFFIQMESDNKEMIFNRISVPNNNIERINGPTGFTGGMGATNPSLGLVNEYFMNDGTSFDWNNPEHAADPWANRENRFIGSIIYNGREWMGRTIETFEGGADMQSVNSTRTGFYLRKFLDGNARWFGGETGVGNHSWPIIRYAEVLLNYAEAMNEAYGPYQDPKGYGITAVQAIEMIRERALMDPYQLPDGLNQNQLREIIHRERKIELAFEEHRPFDLRRWKKAMDILNQTVKGLRIIREEDNNNFTYEVFDAESRSFSEKMYLYPIPQSEVDKNPLMEQNPGW